MAKLIKRLVPGETPSLLDTEKGNELIDLLNAWLQLQITPQGFGKVTPGDKNIILDLTPIRDLINQLQTTVAGFATTAAAGGGGGGGGSTDLSVIIATINGIIAGLNAMTADAECDAVTRTITVTITIDLPEPI